MTQRRPLAPAVGGRFPRTRLRRTRATPWLRRLVAEHSITVDDLIWPLFVIEGSGRREAVSSMPGIERLSIDLAVEKIGAARDSGIPTVAVFPYVGRELRADDCREAANPDNLICRAVRTIADAHPDIGIICDVALDPFNLQGHDGLVRNGRVLNDETVDLLCRQAIVQADAGCAIIAPSDMMDGRVGAIRDALDGAGHEDVAIMSYAAKYASAFYGPFRDAVGSGGYLKGDKRTYQMDPANGNEALTEVALDIDEGADMVMVKPGLPYLDVLHRVKLAFGRPTFAYHVSGEFAMLKAAALQGWLDYDAALLESLIAFKRAGADAVLTYAALDAARLLKSG